MMLDASAIVAILVRETGSDILEEKLLGSSRRMTHAVSVYEAALAIARIKQREVTFGEAEIAGFCEQFRVALSDIGSVETASALDAFARYGKGRHPAALNMGDCFSYACARTRGLPLLYKGSDFAKTDITSA